MINELLKAAVAAGRPEEAATTQVTGQGDPEQAGSREGKGSRGSQGRLAKTSGLATGMDGRGDDVEKRGGKGDTRIWIWGSGYMPFAEKEGQGTEAPFEKYQVRFAVRIESEHISQCVSHLSTRTPTELLI
jgi:hypothetical protein